MGLALRLTFHRAAEILGITTDDVRSLVVEMPRRLPAIYVTQVGHAEPYEWQLLRVDSAGNAFDMSVGGIDGAVHTGFLRIERAALEKFIRDNDLPARHKTEFAPHPATEPGAPVPKPQAAKPAPVVAGSAVDGEAWKLKARQRADEIIKRQRAKDLHPSQEDIADEIAREFRADGVVGAGGKPLTGAYIKRHALKGISSAQNRQLSTSIRRGK